MTGVGSAMGRAWQRAKKQSSALALISYPQAPPEREGVTTLGHETGVGRVTDFPSRPGRLSQASGATDLTSHHYGDDMYGDHLHGGRSPGGPLRGDHPRGDRLHGEHPRGNHAQGERLRGDHVRRDRRATAPPATGGAAAIGGAVGWRRSTYSGAAGECVEVADLAAGTAVRDSKRPDGPALSFRAGTWADFLDSVRS
ncbi:DUF397 domain-containing protein [Streptomyces sp. NPDC058425]|uniref:DUF397 domain-containing protein n=2 Tax=unclassified Streptomyces TaxID=2593676 RepID=UPI0036684B93